MNILIRIIISAVFLALLATNSSCSQTLKKETSSTDSSYPYTNKLTQESSPYLLQHAHNPVNWYPWGDEALEKAKRENKPLLISVGYAACHWCHVMEKESFMDTTVAKLMNDYFVPIKVDREERPDIDQIYMDAAHLVNGSGGWPLNAFALPDGRPFYAGTYYTNEEWQDLLQKVHESYTSYPEKVRQQAEALTKGITSIDLIQEERPKNATAAFLKEAYLAALYSWMALLDKSHGGFDKVPKFPLPASWEYLLQHHYLTGNREALEAVTLTLDKMAMGGIYDHIGGGFARYSTDQYWKVPHFEKMLYDNAQLVSLYAHAYQLTKSTRYKNVIEETLTFVERELSHRDGGFYASLNADSEGEEGKYYVWQKEQIEQLFDKKTAAWVNEYFQVSKAGNWERKNVLYVKSSPYEFAKKHHIQPDTFEKKLINWKQSLVSERARRTRPSTDDKVLTSWNALMLKGYIDAYRALGTHRYLEVALQNATFLQKHMIDKDGKLYRNFKDGKVSVPAFLDDYALLAEAYIELYEVTLDITWLNQAKALIDYTLDHFHDAKSGMFYYTSDDAKGLVVRKMEVVDNVIPSSNAVMAMNLYRLALFYANTRYSSQSLIMLENVLPHISTHGPYYAMWARLAGLLSYGILEVAVLGEEAVQQSMKLQSSYIPNAIFLGGTSENLTLLENKLQKNKTIIYVCENKACKLPVMTAQEALTLIMPKR